VRSPTTSVAWDSFFFWRGVTHSEEGASDDPLRAVFVEFKEPNANSFDVVVSSLAIHNIRGSDGRAKAISEAVRVLRPGGRLAIADIKSTGQYQAQLAKLRMNDCARRKLRWHFWWGGPWAATRLVTATKPERRI
jgi:SAM-dependent methyltransferase